MNWLTKIVEEIEKRHPSGDILIESGGTPSGTYHLGHLRELVIADAILLELRKRERTAKHIYYADDLDALRKIPVNVPQEYEKYLGQPLSDIPAPENATGSYADYFLRGLIDASIALGIDMEFIRSNERYRSGFFAVAIEKALEHSDEVRKILETISGHKLGEDWSPIQINEEGYLKKRRFRSIDKSSKTVSYEDKNGHPQTINYGKGDVKLDWRIDWPARWWLMKVDVEPFGRDHATKGGSYDTGSALMEKVFNAPAPLAVPYDFINMVGDTKKMSASKGTGLDAEGTVKVLPPEIIRYLMLRNQPSKRLYFDPEKGVSELIDEFAALLAKNDKSGSEKRLIEIYTHNINPTISTIPFSHLVASYQAALKDPIKTIDNLRRSDHRGIEGSEQEIIKNQLVFIDQWLEMWAPEDVKFELADKVDKASFNENQVKFLNALADKVKQAPENSGGEWFHTAIYDLKDSSGLETKEIFATLYQAIIGKDSGPRAGWFLSILPRDWLVQRLKLESGNS